jgi:hypothetical protein
LILGEGLIEMVIAYQHVAELFVAGCQTLLVDDIVRRYWADGRDEPPVIRTFSLNGGVHEEERMSGSSSLPNLVARNENDFKATGVKTLNPWRFTAQF